MARKISILIVDDEESVRDSLLNWFIEDGYNVRCAENAKIALLMLENENFDIILADIKMPGMDGIEVLRKIKGVKKETAVIMLTAYGTLETARKAMKLGAYDYVTKPVDHSLLKSLMKEALAMVVKSRRKKK